MVDVSVYCNQVSLKFLNQTQANMMNISYQSTIETKNPEIAFVSDAIYIPASKNYAGGLFDNSGQPIPQATSHRGPSIRLSSPLENTLDINSLPVIESNGPYFFLGEINPHFGHFLLESTARLWPLVHLQGSFSGQYLFCGQAPSSRLFEKRFIKDILGCFSLTPQNMVSYKKPCRLKNVFVPPPAFEIRTQASPIFRLAMQHIGDSIAGNTGGNTNLTPLYLSKSKLSKGVSGIINEAEIEDSLRKKGVDIWHPEMFDLGTQIKEISSRKYLLGSVGSAFHTVLFCPGEKSIAGITLGEKINANYLIIDKLCGNTSAYIPNTQAKIIRADESHIKETSRFSRSFYASNPDYAAEKLIADIGL